MIGLFKKGRIKLHSGKISNFKIECDALTDEDLDTLAFLVSKKVKFGNVTGIARGGLRFAKALRKYETPNDPRFLIVDDVLTTGSSMEDLKKYVICDLSSNIIGVVIFARGKCPKWVTPIFQMWKE